MHTHIIIEKRVGETPLQALEEYRSEHPELAQVPMTYAGRLDPMASGVLLLLIGDECKDRKKYDGLDKAYEFEVLLGITSDTGDVLGLIETCGLVSIPTGENSKRVARSCTGTHTLPYPAFSSKTVNGKPLFQYALEGALDTIQVPTIDVEIYSMDYLGVCTISRSELIEQVIKKINLLKTDPNDTRVGSDFRKDAIIEKWRALPDEPNQCIILKFKISVSSGTYIRTLAPLIAEKLGTCGLAYSIHRTRIDFYYRVHKEADGTVFL